VTYTLIQNQQLKVSLFCAPKSIKICGRVTKLQSVKKWRVLMRHNKMQQI